MSDHFADTNKMVGRTLRTDTLLIAWDMTPEPKVLLDHARQLECELNAANERIKRLEEVGDEVVINYVNSLSAFEMWRKAKEAKP